MYQGALEDTRTEEEKQQDYKAIEVTARGVATFPNVTTVDELPFYETRNQNGSYTCFPANTPVLMENLEYKNIGDIVVGDYVITHTGSKKRVVEKMKRKWQGTMLTIKASGVFPVTCTREHPFLTNRGWINAEQITKDDYLFIPFQNKETRDTTTFEHEKDAEFLFILGLYIADGSISERNVIFSINNTNKLYLVEVIKSFFSKHNIETHVYDKKGTSKGISVIVCSKKWSSEFLRLGNSLCDKKRIAQSLMLLEKELQYRIYEGWIAGDGHIGRNKRNTAVSTSLCLIQQMQTILLRNKIKCNVLERKEVLGRKTAYTLDVANESKNILLPRNRYYYYDDVNDGFFVRVLDMKVVSNYYGGHVYNIEVDDDNSYIVNAIAVHNCVGQAYAKMRGIRLAQKTGKYMPLSASFVYRRKSTAGEGMSMYDVFDIGRKQGIPPEILCPSQNMSEEQILKQEEQPYLDEYAKVLASQDEKYLYLGNHFEEIASVASTKNPVLIFIYATVSEWNRDIPYIEGALDIKKATVCHGITVIGTFSYAGNDYLLVDDSWGTLKSASPTPFGKALLARGQRMLSRDFVNNRVYGAGYIKDLLFTFEETPIQAHHEFTFDLQYGDENADVTALQVFLQHQGLFPKDIPCTGKFFGVTLDAVKKFQTKHNITPVSGYVGIKTRTVLNSL